MTSWVPGLKKVEEAVLKNLDSSIPNKFGVGDPKKEEANCEMIQAFVTCFGVGGLGVEKRRFWLSKDATLTDASKLFVETTGKKHLAQDLLGDENYFAFGHTEMKRPLWYFSNQCNLNISIYYSDHLLKPFAEPTKKKEE